MGTKKKSAARRGTGEKIEPVAIGEVHKRWKKESLRFLRDEEKNQRNATGDPVLVRGVAGGGRSERNTKDSRRKTSREI